MTRALSRSRCCRALAAGLLCLSATAAAGQSRSSDACLRLGSLTLPGVQITQVEVVAAGAFVPPAAPAAGAQAQGGRGGRIGIPPVPGRVTLQSAGLGLGYDGGRARPAFTELPAFCRMAATARPSPTSDIRIEVWLPVSGWNGNFRGTVANGMAGNISYASMAAIVRDGFAVASTDTGHRAADPAWMYDLEKLVDFGHRGVHEMTVAGKAATQAFYGLPPRYSYICECGGASTAAMSAMQRHPGDYDGVVVGGFAAYWTRQVFGQLWAWSATHQDDASFIPSAKFPVIHSAVLAACDTLDGVRDGLLEDPTRCTWDPGTIACAGNDSDTCLTAPQVEAVRKLYRGPINPRTSQPVHSPVFRGSELDWEPLITGAQPIAAFNVFRNFVFKDPAWDFRARPVNYDADVALADRPEAAVINAFDPDISEFVARGGKVILAGGWANAIVPPGAIIDYFTLVRSTIGQDAADGAVRLYMVPGMSECNGGPGTDTFDMMAVMRSWVEERQAPAEVVASRVENGRVVRTRPLCPYPQVATYTGSGSIDLAANFTCR